MKWFKHMTASADDEKMAALVGQGGMEGLALYGAYWRVCEVVAERGQSATLPMQGWARVLGLSARRVIAHLGRMEECRLIEVTTLDSGVRVVIPELIVRESDPRRLPWLVWKVIRKRIFARDCHICQYCRLFAEEPECDHVIPVSRGGTHDDGNLVTACRPCNRSKGAKTSEEYA